MLVEAVAKFPDRLLDLGWRSAYVIEREMKSNYSEGPLLARSGSAGLAGSTHGFAELVGGELNAGSGVDKFYAIVHEEGREIMPTTGDLLHFVNEKTGEEVWTRGPVVIPARKPAQQAAEQAEPEVRQIWERGLSKFVGGS